MKKRIAIDLAEIAVFVALMVVCTLFVEIPFFPVPLTFQTVISIAAGLTLGAKKGAAAMAVYCFMGLVGIPVFAGFGGGIYYVLRPTFGYILGFILSAFTAGAICSGGKVTFVRCVIASVAAFLVNYLVGIPYFAAIWQFYMKGGDLGKYIVLYNLIYMPKDAVLAVLAGVLAWRVVPIVAPARKKDGRRNDPNITQ